MGVRDLVDQAVAFEAAQVVGHLARGDGVGVKAA